MLILMRETESGKMWPMRIFENHDAWVHWLEYDDGESDLFEDGVGAYYLMEGSTYQNLYFPEVVNALIYDEDEEGFVIRNFALDKTWHEDGDWW